jgi:hypothetical protein
MTHATRRAKTATRRVARKTAPKHANGTKLSPSNPPAGFTMSVDELAELIDCGRAGAYDAVRQGVYPSVRQGRAIKVLTAPTLAILRGERPPGGKGSAA